VRIEKKGVSIDERAVARDARLDGKWVLPHQHRAARRRGRRHRPREPAARHLGPRHEPQGTKGLRIRMSAKKKTPKHRSEAAERAFWATRDSSDYVDWTQAQRVAFPDLKPSLKTISLRLPEMMLAELKALANKRDVPYQSLLKMFLAERIAAELQALSKTKGR
jgi:predicted DNA binding CopG/RHH family protein